MPGLLVVHFVNFVILVDLLLTLFNCCLHLFFNLLCRPSKLWIYFLDGVLVTDTAGWEFCFPLVYENIFQTESAKAKSRCPHSFLSRRLLGGKTGLKQKCFLFSFSEGSHSEVEYLREGNNIASCVNCYHLVLTKPCMVF